MRPFGLNRYFSSITKEAGMGILSHIGSPLSDKIYNLISEGRILSALDVGIDPASYADASTFFDDYLAVSVLSKYPFQVPGLDRKGAALEKFLDVEERCRVS